VINLKTAQSLNLDKPRDSQKSGYWRIRHGLEVASARRAAQPSQQLRELPRTGRDDPLDRSGARGTSSERSGADRERSEADKSAAPRVIDRHSCLLKLSVAANEWNILQRARLLACEVATR
jgi:hypothetical protein